MTELDFINRYREEKHMLGQYADYVLDILQTEIVRELNVDLAHFIKVPMSFRLKTEDSLIQKAFYRNKNYSDPYEQITDKIGGRIVVLLEEHTNLVCRVIEHLSDFSFSKDRDFENERKISPELFNYKSHHYILRNRYAIEKIHAPENTPVEIQIRTLLQHAYSELTHDTIYKPNTVASPEIKRQVAKCMALIEVTDQIFSEVNLALSHHRNLFLKIVKDCRSILPGDIESSTDENLCTLILDAFEKETQTYEYGSLKRFANEYDFLLSTIRTRAQSKLLYQQPIIIYVYFLIHMQRKVVKAKWPLNKSELEPLFIDLGLSYDRA